MRLIRNVLIVTSIFVSNLQAQTVIVNNNLQVYGPNPGGTEEFSIGLWQDAARTDSTGIYFDYTGTKVGFNNSTLDESADVYVVKPGDVFSPANIQAGLFPKVFAVYPYSTSTVTVGNSDFYLGLSTGQGIANVPGDYIPNRTAFGWVHLHPSGGLTVGMVDNVMSYNSPGIIIGTPTLVPEPAAIGTAIVAFLCFAGRRWRWKRIS